MSTQKQILLQPHNTLIERYKTQNFYHGIWGYVLPCLYLMNQRGSRNEHFLIHDCGKVMNQHIENLFSLFPYSYSINKQKKKEVGGKKIIVPPWDYYLYQTGRSLEKTFFRRLQNYYRYLNRTYDPLKLFAFHFFPEKIHRVRNQIISQLDQLEYYDLRYKDKVLVLERAAGSTLYFDDGTQKVLPNGKGRKNLTGINHGISHYENLGVNITSYCPGEQSLLHQMQTFRNAKAIICIGGSELANLIWMRPNSIVYVAGFANQIPHTLGQGKLFDLRIKKVTGNMNIPMDETLFAVIDSNDLL